MAIERAVRAAGRMVVWQLAADELSTASSSSLSAHQPMPLVPNTMAPVAANTSPELFGSARKLGPLAAWAA